MMMITRFHGKDIIKTAEINYKFIKADNFYWRLAIYESENLIFSLFIYRISGSWESIFVIFYYCLGFKILQLTFRLHRLLIHFTLHR
jgi:hypothetical protein